jgi:hypothetical protein
LMNICRVSGKPHLWTLPFSSVCFLIKKCCAKSRAPVRAGTALFPGAPIRTSCGRPRVNGSRRDLPEAFKAIAMRLRTLGLP